MGGLKGNAIPSKYNRKWLCILLAFLICTDFVFSATEDLSKDTRVAIITVHGWSPNALMGKWMTERTSDTMLNGMAAAVRKHLDIEEGGNIVGIPLKGHGKIMQRVDNFVKQIKCREDWIDGVKNAEILFVVGHSQGSPTSTILLKHIIDSKIVDPQRQKICLLLIAGISEGPSVRFEGFGFLGWIAKLLGEASTHELFEFRKFDSSISLELRSAYKTILQSGVKVMKLAAASDGVVPVHSALFASLEHPLIRREIYDPKDNDREFLVQFSKLLVTARNEGHKDDSLLSYVGEPVIDTFADPDGHCFIMQKADAYSRAIDFLLNEPAANNSTTPIFNPFDHSLQKVISGYIPWAMRGLVDAGYEKSEIKHIRALYREWNPNAFKQNALLLKLALQPFGDPSQDWIFDDL